MKLTRLALTCLSATYQYSKMTLLYPATGKTQTITLPSY